MKIKKELEVGDVFVWDGDFYMASEHGLSIKLETGECCEFLDVSTRLDLKMIDGSEVFFGELKPGDAFRHQGRLFMRIEDVRPKSVVFRAICEDGMLWSFNTVDGPIYKVDGYVG